MSVHSDMEEERLRRRFLEMRQRAETRGVWIYTDFLTPREQSLLLSLGYEAQPYQFFGGFEGAERRIACFGSEEQCYIPAEPPVACLHVSPKNAKFSGRMGHRDVLGALMGLGIKRETLGDILIHEGEAWVFCLHSMAEYILRELTEVGRTTVVCRRDVPPAFTLEKPEPTSIAAASDRVDALIAAVYKLSRAEASEAIRQGTVFVDSRLIEDPSARVDPGSTVNLRGRGRFIYNGSEGATRSGRLRASVSIYP